MDHDRETNVQVGSQQMGHDHFSGWGISPWRSRSMLINNNNNNLGTTTARGVVRVGDDKLPRYIDGSVAGVLSYHICSGTWATSTPW